MPSPITFKSEKELEAFIGRVALPIARKIAKEEAETMFKNRMSFRAKKESASATSSYQIGTRNPVGQGGGNIGTSGTVTGSRSSSGVGVPIPALTQLLAILDSIGFIKNNSTT